MSEATSRPTLARSLLLFGLLFLVALLPRLYSAQTLGWHWDHPGSFNLVNFDEGGSCRAALQGFDYTGFVGYQTIVVASLLGNPPPPDVAGDERAVKAYCHSPQHLLVARSYSAVTGAMTVVLTAALGLLLVPHLPAVGWTAGALLALSGFHLSESHSGTADVPSVFFIYLFVLIVVLAVARRSGPLLVMSPAFMLFAIWAKYWVFAALAYLACLPSRMWDYASAGLSRWQVIALPVAAAILFGLMSISDFRDGGYYPALALFYLLVPWRRIRRPMILFWLLVPPAVYVMSEIDVVTRFTLSGAEGRFGSGYAAIGWHKWPRNLLNLPLLLLVALGLPALALLPLGVRALLRGEGAVRPWCVMLPFFAFLLFMAFVSPITYYRHYLPLVPLAAILAAWGLHASGAGARRWAVLLFLAWPAALAWDLVSDYHHDPRIALRQWYAEHRDEHIFYSYYVNPPAGRNALFWPEYAAGDAAQLRSGHYVVLSENWYDTAYANELNGPLVHDLQRLVKTKPAYATFYRQALAGKHPLLAPVKTLSVNSFMPELLLHRYLYGNFQLFVGDIHILRIER
ncbi:MAG: hypothetical protein Hals2KO_11360 [Halioglobus sp.]